VSYETEHVGELAPRQVVAYVCPVGHRTSVPLAEEADAVAPEPKAVKPVRTHWDMLLERRTMGELEALLAERLAAVREAEPAPRRKSA
jgi:hypothetical protein